MDKVHPRCCHWSQCLTRLDNLLVNRTAPVWEVALDSELGKVMELA